MFSLYTLNFFNAVRIIGSIVCGEWRDNLLVVLEIETNSKKYNKKKFEHSYFISHKHRKKEWKKALNERKKERKIKERKNKERKKKRERELSLIGFAGKPF